MKYLFLYCLCVLSITLYGQTHEIHGNVVDNAGTPLIGATVVVLEESDSTMLSFGITDDSGRFEIYDLTAGNRILQVSYIGYAGHTSLVSINEQGKISVGEIVLAESTTVLEEVSIKAEHIPMGILGDTINYNAAAFQMRPGSSVEDLLKKLPGIEVARDGSIKAQGEDVKNILVDGKEFFSGDATIATKNLEAEFVDKVQVFDKKSEEAEFTGVDDANEEKTINLKLKEDYKNGGFGKVDLNGGTESTRNAKINYNRFSPSVQVSAIGNVNNINENVFSLTDYLDFMGGFQNALDGGGFNMFRGFGNGQPDGINDQNALGTNLNLQISPKLKLNAHYLLANSDLNTNRQTTSQTFTEVQNFTAIDTFLSNQKTANHRINTKLKFKPNPMNVFSLSTKGFFLANDEMTNSARTVLIENLRQNQSTNIQQTNAQSSGINTNLLYKKKFLKKGRNLSVRANLESTNRSEESEVDYDIFGIDIGENSLQRQTFESRLQALSGTFNYTEPISRNLYLTLSANATNQEESPIRQYFDLSSAVDKELLDLSSSFIKSLDQFDAGISLKRNSKKLKLKAGLQFADLYLVAQEGEVQLNDKSKYEYFLPSFSISKNFKGSNTLDFSYDTQVTSPKLSKMVTQVNNLNPNFLILGNPNLNPEYVHRAGLSYNNFDEFNFSSFIWAVDASFSNNKIVDSRAYLPGLVTQILPINAKKYFSLTSYIHHSSPIRKLKVKYSINSTLSYNQYQNQIDGVSNTVKMAMLMTGLMVENRKKDRFDVAAGIDLDLNAVSNDFNSNFDSPFLNHSLYFDGFLNVGKGWNIGTKYDYKTFNNAFFNEGQVLHLLDATLSKSFLENKLMVKVTAHDLLNQNRGISRTGGINTLSDTRFITLGRYIMLGASYRIGIAKKRGLTVEQGRD